MAKDTPIEEIYTCILKASKKASIYENTYFEAQILSTTNKTIAIKNEDQNKVFRVSLKHFYKHYRIIEITKTLEQYRRQYIICPTYAKLTDQAYEIKPV